ncbi:MAG: LysE family transporter [Rhodospirillales bacterium]
MEPLAGAPETAQLLHDAAVGASQLLQAFLLGVVIKATPGPIFAESLRRGIVGGFRPALAVQLGSLLGTAFWAGWAGVADDLLLQTPLSKQLLSLAAAAVLAMLGWQSVRRARRGTTASARASGSAAWLAGAALSLCNPWAVASSAVVSVAADGNKGDQAPSSLTIIVSYLAGTLLWCVVIAAAIALLRTRLTPRFCVVLDAICGSVMLIIANVIVWETLLSPV